MTPKTESVGSKLVTEIARVSELRGLYLSIGPGGAIAATMMKQAIDEASESLLDDDPARCIRALSELGSFTE